LQFFIIHTSDGRALADILVDSFDLSHSDMVFFFFNALQHVYTGSTATFSTADYTAIPMSYVRCRAAVHDCMTVDSDALSANERHASSSKARP